MSGTASRPFVWLAAAVLPMLVALVWWMLERPARAPRAGVEIVEGERALGSKPPRGPASRELGRSPSAAEPDDEAVIAATLVAPETGNLTEGAVVLRCAGGSGEPRQLGLDEAGRFVAAACEEGATCVRLRHSHFEQPRAWELAPNTEELLEVELGPRIAGRVASAAGEAISGASIIDLSPPSGTERAATRSDADGEFELVVPRLRPCDTCDGPGAPASQPVACRSPAAGEADEPARVLVTAPGFAPVEHEVARGSGEWVEIELPSPAAPISGRVLGSDGLAFGQRTSVLAVHVEREHEVHATTTDAGGRFELTSLGEGRYRIRAVRDGLELARADAVAPGEDIELRADLGARGRAWTIEIVTDQAAPVAGARVNGGPFRAAETDARGRVEASAVLPGDYTLSIRAPKCPVLRVRVGVTAEHAPAREQIELSGC